jgi:hypothetical protein
MPKGRKWGAGKLRAYVAILAISIAVLTAFASSATAAVPANFWGIVPQATPTPEQFQRLKRGGVDSIRTPIGWSTVQPVAGGPFDWSAVDTVIRGAVTARLEVLPFVSGAPSWAVPINKRFGSPMTLPVRTGVQRSGWKNFVRQAVLRYGPNGGFWAENPELPMRPLRTWQVWNEQNFEYFVARPNPAEYGKLLKLSYSAIKGVDRGAKILLGGLFAAPREAEFKRKPPLAYFASDFLDLLYKTTPGVKSKFDGIALHPYTTTYKRLPRYIEESLDVLKAHHDAGKELWLTELGWSSQKPTPNNSFAKGRSGQAAQLKGAFRILRDNQRKWNLQRIYWFSVDDQENACNFCDGSGLFGEGFAPKPAWFAFTQFSGGKPN